MTNECRSKNIFLLYTVVDCESLVSVWHVHVQCGLAFLSSAVCRSAGLPGDDGNVWQQRWRSMRKSRLWDEELSGKHDLTQQHFSVDSCYTRLFMWNRVVVVRRERRKLVVRKASAPNTDVTGASKQNCSEHFESSQNQTSTLSISYFFANNSNFSSTESLLELQQCFTLSYVIAGSPNRVTLNRTFWKAALKLGFANLQSPSATWCL